jgi:hypothetical protein
MLQLVVGTNQAAVDWSASTDNVAVTGYEVFRGGTLVATVPTTHFLDSGLAANTSYTYQVRAVDAAGNRSAASSSLNVRTQSQGTGSSGNLSGVAFDGNGQTIGRAMATFTASNGVTKNDRANSRGVWSISNLASGPGTLTVSANGHPTRTYTVSIVGGKTVLAYATLA